MLRRPEGNSDTSESEDGSRSKEYGEIAGALGGEFAGSPRGSADSRSVAIPIEKIIIIIMNFTPW